METVIIPNIGELGHSRRIPEGLDSQASPMLILWDASSLPAHSWDCLNIIFRDIPHTSMRVFVSYDQDLSLYTTEVVHGDRHSIGLMLTIDALDHCKNNQDGIQVCLIADTVAYEPLLTRLAGQILVVSKGCLEPYCDNHVMWDEICPSFVPTGGKVGMMENVQPKAVSPYTVRTDSPTTHYYEHMELLTGITPTETTLLRNLITRCLPSYGLRESMVPTHLIVQLLQHDRVRFPTPQAAQSLVDRGIRCQVVEEKDIDLLSVLLVIDHEEPDPQVELANLVSPLSTPKSGPMDVLQSGKDTRVTEEIATSVVDSDVALVSIDEDSVDESTDEGEAGSAEDDDVSHEDSSSNEQENKSSLSTDEWVPVARDTKTPRATSSYISHFEYSVLYHIVQHVQNELPDTPDQLKSRICNVLDAKMELFGSRVARNDLIHRATKSGLFKDIQGDCCSYLEWIGPVPLVPNEFDQSISLVSVWHHIQPRVFKEIEVYPYVLLAEESSMVEKNKLWAGMFHRQLRGGSKFCMVLSTSRNTLIEFVRRYPALKSSTFLDWRIKLFG